MKRVLTILAILILPLSVWAMTPVTDSDLSKVTGQAGVSINQDVMLHITMDTMAWGDQDGLGGSFVTTTTVTANGSTGLNPWGTLNDGGFIGIKDFDMKLRIKARTTDTYNGFNSVGLNGAGTIGGVYNANWAGYPGLRPLTIDVATADGVAGTPGAAYGNGTTFVRIGLGAMEIDVNALQFDVALSERNGTAAPALDQVLGTVSMGAIGIYINPESYIDIYNNRSFGSGVSFTMDIIVDQFNMNYISWGNIGGWVNDDQGDPSILTTVISVYQGGSLITTVGVGAGFPWAAATTAGYVGLANLQVGGPITIVGTVNIDVGTVTAGYYAQATDHLTGGRDNKLPMVQITFGQDAYTNNGPNTANWDDLGLKITVPSITADVRIADNFELNQGAASPTCNTLGDIYISGFEMNIVKGSWVDIFAH